MTTDNPTPTPTEQADASAELLRRELINLLFEWPQRNEFWLRTQGSLRADGIIDYGLSAYEIIVRRREVKRG